MHDACFPLALRMPKIRNRVPVIAGLLLALSATLSANAGEPTFPVIPELFIDAFDAAEGITFNGEGRLFIAANRNVPRRSGELARRVPRIILLMGSL